MPIFAPLPAAFGVNMQTRDARMPLTQSCNIVPQSIGINELRNWQFDAIFYPKIVIPYAKMERHTRDHRYMLLPKTRLLGKRADGQ